MAFTQECWSHTDTGLEDSDDEDSEAENDGTFRHEPPAPPVPTLSAVDEAYFNYNGSPRYKAAVSAYMKRKKKEIEPNNKKPRLDIPRLNTLPEALGFAEALSQL